MLKKHQAQTRKLTGRLLRERRGEKLGRGKSALTIGEENVAAFDYEKYLARANQLFLGRERQNDDCGMLGRHLR